MKRRVSEIVAREQYGDLIVPLLVEHDLLIETQIDDYKDYLKEEFVENS